MQASSYNMKYSGVKDTSMNAGDVIKNSHFLCMNVVS